MLLLIWLAGTAPLPTALAQAQLQERLGALGLPKTGKKDELVARLAAGLAAAAGASPQEAVAPPAAAPEQPQGKGSRGGRRPPVAAAVAQKHVGDEIPSYPPMVRWAGAGGVLQRVAPALACCCCARALGGG